MRTLIALALVISSLMAHSAFAGDNKESNGSGSIEHFMQLYLDGYEAYLTGGDTADVVTVTSHFTEPLVMMPPTGPAPMATHEKFAPNIKFFMDKVLKPQGIVKLEWEKLQIAKLSDTQALVSGLANALDASGKTVEQRASIYLLTKTNEGWAVSVNLPHSPATIPSLSAS